MKQDMYQEVTNKVIEMMETHGADWVNPFARKGRSLSPFNVTSKKAYKGINTLLLGWSQYASPVWGTYKQWNEKGCQVRKGQKATGIVFWQFIEKTDEDGRKQKIPFMRSYSVFNAEQVDGFTIGQQEEQNDVEDIQTAEHFFSQIPANIKHSQEGKAFYSPFGDYVHMPQKSLFEATPTSTATECYYSTLAHELTHWTGAKHRLDRLTGDAFGSEGYAREELVAEVGAALLCAHLQISATPRPDHAKYINGWIRRLSDNKREFVSAASAAAKAVDFLLNTEEVQGSVSEAA
jgi:antirestriction protein ArdC